MVTEGPWGDNFAFSLSESGFPAIGLSLCYSIRMVSSYVRFGNTQRFFLGKNIEHKKKEWGEEQWIVNKEYCGKKLMLWKNRRCSLHKHQKKDEVFYLLSGRVQMEVDDETFVLCPGDFVHIPFGVYHRFTGLEESEIMEFSTNHQEDDSYRKEYSGHADPKRYERQSALLKKCASQKILVVGDVMLDRYTSGHIERISPEAPVPIVQVSGHRHALGGAGNSAHGIRQLGGHVQLVGVVGADVDGDTLQALLKECKVRVAFLRDSQRCTTVKERIVSSDGQQILRIDAENTSLISGVLENKLIMMVEKACVSVTGVLLSDYAKGVLTPRLIAAVCSAARRRKIPVVIDPKPHGVSSLVHLKDATVTTPNVREARCLLGDIAVREEEVGGMLSRRLKGYVVLTRGGNGIDLYSKGKKLEHYDALSPEVVDVSGAGDTVAAVITLCLAAGGSIEDAVDMGNRAASVTVQRRGVATVSSAELESVL